MNDVREKLKTAANFIKNDVWRIRRATLPPKQSFLLKLLRVVLLSVRGFDEDKCQLRASALTFYSLVSIVPVFAMAFGIAKGFGMEKVLEGQLRDKLAGHEDILVNVIQFSHSLLANTRGGLIAGMGLIVLFWSVVKVLGQIESSFNDIWGVKEKRSLGRMFGDYLSLMLVCPVIFILSGGLTVFLATQLGVLVNKFAVLGSVSSMIFFSLKLVPYLLMGALFTFLYMFMPNTKVRFSAGLIAGIVTGTIFQILQWAYITFQIGVVKYNAIYGSFAALPLFLAWLQLSWLIVLYGAELSFAYQNVDTYEFETDSLQASPRLKTLLALQITARLVKLFIRGEKPPTAQELSVQLDIPVRFIQEILFELTQSRVLVVAQREPDADPGYLPAMDVNRLTVSFVVDALQKRGVGELSFTKDSDYEKLSAALDAFDRHVEKLPENKLLKDI